MEILNIDNSNSSFLHAGQETESQDFNNTYPYKDKFYFKRSLRKQNLNLQTKPKLYDILLGYVLTIRQNFAIIQSQKIIQPNLRYSGVYFLPISEIKDSYVKDIKSCLSPHDLVLFKIIDLEKDRITIKSPELGVVYTSCSRCNTIVNQSFKNQAICQNCSLINQRKYSDKYGQNFNF